MTQVTRPTRAAERPASGIMNKAVTEASFQQQVIAYARLRGWRVAHFRPAMNRRGVWATQMQGDPGFPDLVLARHDRVIFAELKSEKGRSTSDQIAWANTMGGVFLWRPSDWDT